MQSFKNLKVWEKAHILTLDVYRSSRAFPREETYGLTSQMRRSSASIGQTLRKGRAERETASLAGSCKSPWAQRANLNTICSSHMI